MFDAPLKDGGRLHVVLLYSDGGLNARLIRKGEIVTLDLPDIHFRGPATVVAIQRASTSGDVEAEVIRVVQFRDDDDLGKVLYGEWKPPQDFLERWAGRRRTIVMRMDFPDNRWCEIQLLRTVKWIEQNGARVGGAVFLDLTDVGVRGWANVLEIHPCPVPEEFGGEMVTGTFKYSHGRIGELVLESESKPIGVTPSHLFWSEDRQTWVQVSQLQPGETVKTMDGLTRVVSFAMTDRVEPVYNIEVAYDHVYRVGDGGILVHNQSAGNPNQAQSSQSQPDHVFATEFGSRLTDFADDLDCYWPELAAAFRAAKPSTQTPPFGLTVTRNIPRPDQHSIVFGNAVRTMRSEISAFVQTAAQQGSDAAKTAHKARLQNAWTALVAAVEDTDVANLVPQNQQNLVSQGRQTLLQIKFAVAPVIDAG